MNEDDRTQTAARAPKRSIFLPLMLVTVAVAGHIYSEVFGALDRRAALEHRIENLSVSVTDASKVRDQFEALATGVASLAEGGNRNAAGIVERLTKAGVTFNQDR